MSIQNNSKIHNLEISLIAKGAGIFFIGSIIGVGLRYIFELIVARNLGPDQFGLFFLGFSALKIMEIVSTLGLHRGVLRYIALFKGEGDEERIKGTIILAIKVVIIVGLIFSSCTIVLSKFVATNIFHEADLTKVLKIFAVAIPFTALTTTLVFSTQSFKMMRYTVYVREIFEPAIRIIIVTLMFIIGWKLYGAILALIISLMMGTFLAFYYLKNLFPNLTNKKIKPIYESRKIFVFSWPLLLAEFFGFIVIWINILMIGYFKASQEVGVYSASHRTALLGGIILVSFNSIFSPII
ncbi:MAG: oligosaccharide flippase family protein, partial [Candidatus Odinarchaeota archaeon]